MSRVSRKKKERPNKISKTKDLIEVVAEALIGHREMMENQCILSIRQFLREVKNLNPNPINPNRNRYQNRIRQHHSVEYNKIQRLACSTRSNNKRNKSNKN